MTFVKKYSLSVVNTVVLCAWALTSACHSGSKTHDDDSKAATGAQAALKKHHDHPNTAAGTSAAMKEIIAVVDQSLADLPPPASAPAVCEGVMAKRREVSKTSPDANGAANANLAILRCTSKATNDAKCKGKAGPCGVAYYNLPIKLPTPGERAAEPSASKAVDVAVPGEIAAACKEIDGADGAASVSGGADAADYILNSMIGNYSCGAWLKAAAKNDPTLLIVPTFVPTIQLLRDLRTYANGPGDVTPDAVLAEKIKRVDRAVVARQIQGTFIPVAVLSIVPAGGVPGEVLDGAQQAVQERVIQTAQAVRDSCKGAGLCH